jgi:predicted phosphohydrolase
MNKKITVSKIVLFIPYILSVIILGLVIWAVTKEKSLTTITALSSIYGATIVIAGYTNKWYAKKASLENEPKVRLGVIKETIQLARDNPDLKIYDTTQIKQDIQNIVNPIKSDEQKSYENLVTEDVNTKIS